MKERCERLISLKLRLPPWFNQDWKRMKSWKMSLLCKSRSHITMSVLPRRYMGFEGMGRGMETVCSYYLSQENFTSFTYSNFFHSYFQAHKDPWSSLRVNFSFLPMPDIYLCDTHLVIHNHTSSCIAFLFLLQSKIYSNRFYNFKYHKVFYFIDCYSAQWWLLPSLKVSQRILSKGILKI